jgi:hypothetical protein
MYDKAYRYDQGSEYKATSFVGIVIIHDTPSRRNIRVKWSRPANQLLVQNLARPLMAVVLVEGLVLHQAV